MKRLAGQEITRSWPCALLLDLESGGAKVLLPLPSFGNRACSMPSACPHVRGPNGTPPG